MAEPTVEIPRYPSLFRQSGPASRRPAPPPAAPPGSGPTAAHSVPWEVLTGVVIGVTLTYLAATLGQGYALLTGHATGGDGYRWAVAGYLAAVAIWLPVTHRFVLRRGDARATAMRRWSLRLWGLAVIASLLLTLLPWLSRIEPGQLALAQTGTRAVGAGLFLIALWTVNARIRAATVHSAPIGASEADGFWSEVEALVTRTGAELPILEAGPASIRRWHLARPGRVAAVRAAVAPGSRVTAFPTPPRPVTEHLVADLIGELAPVLSPGFRPRGGEPSTVVGTDDALFVGLIEEVEGGALRFARLGTAAEILPWLERVRHARRCGVYRTGTPGAPSTMVGP